MVASGELNPAPREPMDRPVSREARERLAALESRVDAIEDRFDRGLEAVGEQVGALGVEIRKVTRTFEYSKGAWWMFVAILSFVVGVAFVSMGLHDFWRWITGK